LIVKYSKDFTEVLCSHAKKKDIAAATLPIIVSFLLAFVSLASSFAFFFFVFFFFVFLRGGRQTKFPKNEALGPQVK